MTQLGDSVLLWKQGTRVIFAGGMRVRRDPRFQLGQCACVCAFASNPPAQHDIHYSNIAILVQPFLLSLIDMALKCMSLIILYHLKALNLTASYHNLQCFLSYPLCIFPQSFDIIGGYLLKDCFLIQENIINKKCKCACKYCTVLFFKPL